MLCSMNLFPAMNLKVEFLRQEVNIFKGALSKVMGRKSAGSDASPFLRVKIVQAFLIIIIIMNI